MKNSILIVLAATIIMAVNPLITSAQAKDKTSDNYIYSDKQAQSQTKGMALLLNLKEPLTTAVYKINLKYQLLTDSLRLSTTQTSAKKEMHAQITGQKNAELKSTLSTEQYNKYMLILENARTQLNTRVHR
jgi:hypothetical protein